MKRTKAVCRAVMPYMLLLFFALSGCAAPAADVSAPPPAAPVSPAVPTPQNPPPEPPAPPEKPDPSRMTGEILSAMTFPDMVELDEKKTELFYGLNKEVYDAASIYLCAEAQAYEVAVIRAKENQANVVIKGIEERLLTQKDSFKDYLPEQYDLLQNALLKANGDYILFAVTDDNELCEEIFDRYFP